MAFSSSADIVHQTFAASNYPSTMSAFARATAPLFSSIGINLSFPAHAKSRKSRRKSKS
jgi:hypothetical protein